MWMSAVVLQQSKGCSEYQCMLPALHLLVQMLKQTLKDVGFAKVVTRHCDSPLLTVRYVLPAQCRLAVVLIKL
jgi:hypothetical protein